MTVVRTAHPGDGAILLDMTRHLAEHHGLLHRVVAQAADYEHHLFVDKPLIGALIAEVDGVPAGAVVWHRSFSTNSAREIIYLEDLTVLPAFRRLGVGKALMQALANLALERGYSAIFWMAFDWNEAAVKFYREIGAEVEQGAVLCQVRGDALMLLAGDR